MHSVKEVFDKTTGELIKSEEVKNFSVPAEPEYVKMYLKDIASIYSISPLTNKILFHMLAESTYANIVNINPTVKRSICMLVNTSMSTFNNCLSELKAAGIVKEVGRGSYMLNPDLFGKGPWTQVYKNRAIYQSIKVTTVYTAKGSKKVETEIVDDVEAIQEAADAADMSMDDFIDSLDGDINFG
ncbi:TPA: replication/maintenance protein RepL [Pseudomonas aeruginosa]|nr:replication/maintenance protein RepL [Pseudomonas aeruginosa]EKX5071165.1 replication/maintenance protein RepL [Pseudomonas aeruginosa]HCF2750532.1 replication/maintenance protein RepL [Pseudomonas aeruginosa]HCF2763187.1 replication/maintenance protein RepL [Pseudomonas aeruginosa]HCF3833821.1 replication/maintenance protein RepL [Pseudomonas aeruginosa]